MSEASRFPFGAIVSETRRAPLPCTMRRGKARDYQHKRLSGMSGGRSF